MPRSKKTTPPVDFEKALQELEALVERMEKGELSLEESLMEFERGVTLTRACQQALKEAEQKVRILTGEDKEQDFKAEAEDDGDN